MGLREFQESIWKQCLQMLPPGGTYCTASESGSFRNAPNWHQEIYGPNEFNKLSQGPIWHSGTGIRSHVSPSTHRLLERRVHKCFPERAKGYFTLAHLFRFLSSGKSVFLNRLFYLQNCKKSKRFNAQQLTLSWMLLTVNGESVTEPLPFLGKTRWL